MHAVIAAAVLALAPATAYRGETSQKQLASVVVAADGQVQRVRIAYSAPCSDPRYRFPNTMRFEPPFDSATPDAVTETLTLREHLKGGGRTRQTVTLTATRANDVWSGTFATKVVLTRAGKRLDTCVLKRVRWTATRVQ
jgi:ABC-type histidine transport system ATPase subunit